MNGHLSEVITLKAEWSTHFGYDNHPIANINDHVVRIATMTEPYHKGWRTQADMSSPISIGQVRSSPR
jgi:hypothetical protein